MNTIETGDRYTEAQQKLGLTDDETRLLRAYGFVFVNTEDGMGALLVDQQRNPGVELGTMLH